MSTAAEYLERAAEDEALARLVSRHDYRDYFLDQARQWRARAAAVDGNPQGNPTADCASWEVPCPDERSAIDIALALFGCSSLADR